MKQLIIFISIIYTATCFSQNLDPQLCQTWCLKFVQASDGDIPYNVSEIEPQISPTLTISNDLSFNGDGACNSFQGVFTIEPAGYLQNDQFSQSTNDCNIQVHNSFELPYFDFMRSGGFYQIIPQNEGLVLMISNFIFGSAIFTNYPLNNTSFDFNRITIYPNPVKSKFSLSYPNLMISKVEIFNSLGQNIKTINDNFEEIDMSAITSGIYILKITTEFGIIKKKMLKSD